MGVFLSLLENIAGMANKSSGLQCPVTNEAVLMSLGVLSFHPSVWNMLCFVCEMFLFLCCFGFLLFFFFFNLPHYWSEAQKKEDSIGSVIAAW